MERSSVEVDPLQASSAAVSVKSPGRLAARWEQSEGLMVAYLSGETRLMLLPRATVEEVTGALEMTSYQLRLLGGVAVPLGAILSVGAENGTLTVVCKDVRRVRFLMSEREASEACKLVRACAFGEPFCLSHAPQFATGEEIWEPGAAYEEWLAAWSALHPDNTPAPWRLSDANVSYASCASYPERLVVPASISDGVVAAAATFRAEGRVPALTWASAEDGASIWRSSQPKVGVQGATNASDEALVRAIATAAGGRGCEIVDCRPKTSANANRLGGHGFESRDRYKECRVSFANVPNMHSMRDSYKQLWALATRAPSRDDSDDPSPRNDLLTTKPSTSDLSWLALVEETKWLAAIRRLLAAAWDVANKVHRHRCRVLVHCSHGWDRTSQVVSLAQIFVDPKTRTLDGFGRLIEKDFVAFGHPFATRSGRNQSKATDQTAPIFLQFLDAVAQLVALFPTRFEFDARLLILLADQLYACRFDTFVCDTVDARAKIRANRPAPCASVWDYVRANKHHLSASLYDDDSSSDPILLPPLSYLLRNVNLWADYHMRYSAPPFVPRDDPDDPLSDPDARLPTMRFAAELWDSHVRAARRDAETWQRRADVSERRADRSRLFNMLTESAPHDDDHLGKERRRRRPDDD
ncbi:hypothetical protein CTAYLR_000980 [Chrysophaeum taylorii]|uniref:Myotubularin phosphatase domain-containing protein n=1 Tax=Chrysophaeum taylorii TaxID=2483200 RepID=A0AAD7UFE4_9STRA|nr:hypothetical protein CTAYLR_000980 [Chrysophaeum taylorii]